MMIRVTLLAIVMVLCAAVRAGERVHDLRLMDGNYPRAFFFRDSERTEHLTYEQWSSDFDRLEGIMGKALQEELARPATNAEYFTRFKHEHPDQGVFLHFNGDARDPRWETKGRYSAGHWLYYNGAVVQDELAAKTGEMTLHVSDASLFKTNMGLYRNSNEDVGICALTDDGRPDWSRAEQVELLAVDRAAGTIRVRRAQYGTDPIALPAGRAYAAAHVCEGPWGAKSHLLWHYNYSTVAPPDAQGQRAGEILAHELGDWFGNGGLLEAYDGVEFDVLHDAVIPTRGGRGPDYNADGRADDGVFNGVQTYGQGVTQFCKLVREALGPDRIIMADGALGGPRGQSQRANAYLDGIESEGWPDTRDPEIHEWSGGLNRMAYWAKNHAPGPGLNYVNYKFVERDRKTGKVTVKQVPFSTNRLVFAAAVMCDAAICCINEPPRDAQGRPGIWDELTMGDQHKIGYLGKPLGEAVHLATRSPDLFAAKGLTRLKTDSTKIESIAGGIRAAVAKGAAIELHVPDVSSDGSPLLVVMTTRTEGEAPEGPSRPRMLRVGLASNSEPTDSFMSWSGPSDFTSTFYFEHPPKSDHVELRVDAEGTRPLIITSLALFRGADAMARAFEHGVVLANPSEQPYTFDLSAIAPGRTFHRLKATEGQDAKTNDGSVIADGHVTLGTKDALFLVD
jgi:hypothetical protein